MSADELKKKIEHAFPLALAKRGERVRVAALRTDKGQERRLYDLGMPVGAEIRVVASEGRGRMIVASGHGRLALGSGMTQRIMVVLSAPAIPKESIPALSELSPLTVVEGP